MNIIQKIRAKEAQFAELPAIIEPDRSWTYAEFYGRVDRLANALIALGVRKGDVLLCWLPNIREALETELACLQIGAIWVTLNAGLTWPEVEQAVHSTEPAVIVTSASLFTRIQPSSADIEQALERTPFVVQGTRTSGTTLGPVTPFEQAIESGAPVKPDVDVSEQDVARLRYTSGTTGAAKAAILSHRVYLGSLANLQEHLHSLSEDDRVLHAAPLTHATAALSYPILAAGGANVILPAFDPETVLETIERHRITTMFAVPTMLQRLAAAPSINARDVSSIRTISYGGAPMPEEKLLPLIEKLGPVFMQIYGLTEALHPVTCLQRQEHFKGNPKLGSAGRLTRSCQIRIVDDNGNDLEDGSVGEFTIKGPITFSGYWRDPEETAKTLRDGWVASGDLGFRDADGYYWIVDRKKNVIISGGFNVYASEVEAVLAAHPAVLEAAVIGMPHEDWGETVHAIVQRREDEPLSEAELLAWCRKRLAGYKTPKGVTFIRNPLPRNSAGKIARNDVLDLIEPADPARR